ncbi:MAG TPA: cob(I)yrinic acid a,c-diamide adenosyltransferase, partial [Candidatus Woesearchaeota archaeon]|nr:cob(I)yrinic acid a,c-diamide adenosyltransferase [Candidatus Woesearchaeota archaeon]
MIIVYTGNGKGKTTAALGLALRSLGHKNKVTCIHFMKNFASGESKFESNFYESHQFGSGNFVVENPVLEDLQLAEEGFALAKTKITDCDVLI